MTISINPYIIFDGNTDKALALYERVFGVKAEVSRFGDIPGGQVPDEHKHRIMHARLLIGSTPLMLSDSQPGMPFPKERSNVHIAVQLDDLADARAKFAALAEGGAVEMPLADAFWGGVFGSLTDAFGIQWMFNCEAKKA